MDHALSVCIQLFWWFSAAPRCMNGDHHYRTASTRLTLRQSPCWTAASHCSAMLWGRCESTKNYSSRERSCLENRKGKKDSSWSYLPWRKKSWDWTMTANIKDKKGFCWPQWNNFFFLTVVVGTRSDGLKLQQEKFWLEGRTKCFCQQGSEAL